MCLSGTDETSQVPYKGLLHMHGVYDCARFDIMLAKAHDPMLPSPQQNGIGTSKFGQFRSSIPSLWSPL